MDKYAKAVVGGLTAGGAAFIAALGSRPLAIVITLTVIGFASGFGGVWATTNAPAEPTGSNMQG